VARIDQVIVPVDVIDIDVIAIVIPVGRPGFGVLEIIAAVIKAAIVAAVHSKIMFAAETGAKLLIRDTAAASALIRVTAVVVLFGLLCTLLVLRPILLLYGPGLVIAIVLVLLGSIILLGPIVLLRPVILLRAIVLPRLIVLPGPIILARTIVLLPGVGAISILLLPIRFLLRAIGRFFLVLAASVGLLSLFWLFLLFWFLLGFISIGFLTCVAGGTDKENHHCGTKDEFHFGSSVSFFANSQACVVGQTANLGLAGMVTCSMATKKGSIGEWA
jgi:hypothetical protein